MTDLQQVAERLRKLYLFREASTEVLAATLDEIYGKGNRLNAYSDECCAAEDWLAERDPTPLTVEIVLSFGLSVCSAVAAEVQVGEFVLMLNYPSETDWFIDGGRIISTVGELRTIARLAGVGLKGKESQT